MFSEELAEAVKALDTARRQLDKAQRSTLVAAATYGERRKDGEAILLSYVDGALLELSAQVHTIALRARRYKRSYAAMVARSANG